MSAESPPTATAACHRRMSCGEETSVAGGSGMVSSAWAARLVGARRRAYEQHEESGHSRRGIARPRGGYLGRSSPNDFGPGDQMNRRLCRGCPRWPWCPAATTNTSAKITNQDGLVPPDQFAALRHRAGRGHRDRARVRPRRPGHARRAREAGRRREDLCGNVAGRRRRPRRSAGPPSDRFDSRAAGDSALPPSRTARAAPTRPASSEPRAAKP